MAGWLADVCCACSKNVVALCAKPTFKIGYMMVKIRQTTTHMDGWQIDTHTCHDQSSIQSNWYEKYFSQSTIIVWYGIMNALLFPYFFPVAVSSSVLLTSFLLTFLLLFHALYLLLFHHCVHYLPSTVFCVFTVPCYYLSCCYFIVEFHVLPTTVFHVQCKYIRCKING